MYSSYTIKYKAIVFECMGVLSTYLSTVNKAPCIIGMVGKLQLEFIINYELLLCTISGMEWWNVTLEWNTGMIQSSKLYKFFDNDTILH